MSSLSLYTQKGCIIDHSTIPFWPPFQVDPYFSLIISIRKFTVLNKYGWTNLLFQKPEGNPFLMVIVLKIVTIYYFGWHTQISRFMMQKSENTWIKTSLKIFKCYMKILYSYQGHLTTISNYPISQPSIHASDEWNGFWPRCFYPLFYTKCGIFTEQYILTSTCK